jgi:hypothetical protein
VPALEILAAALLVFGTALVFRALIESDRLLEDATSLDTHEPEAEEAGPLRRAA